MFVAKVVKSLIILLISTGNYPEEDIQMHPWCATRYISITVRFFVHKDQ